MPYWPSWVNFSRHDAPLAGHFYITYGSVAHIRRVKPPHSLAYAAVDTGYSRYCTHRVVRTALPVRIYLPAAGGNESRGQKRRRVAWSTLERATARWRFSRGKWVCESRRCASCAGHETIERVWFATHDCGAAKFPDWRMRRPRFWHKYWEMPAYFITSRPLKAADKEKRDWFVMFGALFLWRFGFDTIWDSEATNQSVVKSWPHDRKICIKHEISQSFCVGFLFWNRLACELLIFLYEKLELFGSVFQTCLLQIQRKKWF